MEALQVKPYARKIRKIMTHASSTVVELPAIAVATVSDPSDTVKRRAVFSSIRTKIQRCISPFAKISQNC
jgi:hypothetical protein